MTGAAAEPATEQEPTPFGWRFFLVHCLGSILVGGGIYLAFRTEGLLMFDWAHNIGLLPVLRDLREHTLPLADRLPDWFLFSVPDGCWVYCCTAFFARLWRDGPLWARAAWIGIGPALAIGGEVGQLEILDIVPGTFDPVDVLCYAVAGLAAYWFANRP